MIGSQPLVVPLEAKFAATSAIPELQLGEFVAAYKKQTI
jgi:hypothetical protein